MSLFVKYFFTTWNVKRKKDTIMGRRGVGIGRQAGLKILW